MTGDTKTDELVLKLWQSLPLGKRRDNASELWTRVACLVHHGPSEPSPETAREIAFRRSYMQAAAAATQALEAGANQRDLRAWLQPLYAWRYTRRHGVVAMPPACGAARRASA